MHRTISIDTRLFFGAGIGTYLRSLVPLLVDRMEGCRFNLLGNSDEISATALAAHPAVRIIPFSAPLYGWREQKAWAGLIPKDTDLFWSPNYNFPLFFRGLVLATVHDLIHLECWSGLRENLRRVYAEFMMKRLARKADRIIAVSSFTRDRLEQRAGIPGAHIEVIPNGLESHWFAAKPVSPPHPRPYILFVGSLKPHKNLAGLVRAFIGIADRIPCDLVIVGRRKGLYIKDGESEKLAKAMPKRIIFAGEVSEAALEQYYLHATMLALPSFYEGFGFPPLEAMASGCPALVSRATSLPEICGEAAFFVDPADIRDMASGLMRLVQDETLRSNLIRRGRERAAIYSWDRCADATAATLRSLLA